MPGFQNRRLRRSCFFALLAGLGCVLVATAPLRAQEPSAPPQSEMALSTVSGASLLAPARAETFAALIQEIGFDDLQARKEAATGEPQFRVDWRKVNRQSIGLTEDQWNTAYAILLEGSDRIDASSDQMHEALGWSDGRFQIDPSKHTAQQLAKIDSLSRQGPRIMDDTIAKLRHALGEEGFSRLSSFVDQREGGERIVDHRGPIQRGPVQTAKVSVPLGSSPQK